MVISKNIKNIVLYVWGCPIFSCAWILMCTHFKIYKTIPLSHTGTISKQCLCESIGIQDDTEL